MRRSFVIAVLALLVARAGAGETVIARRGDASVSHDADAGTWSIAAGGTTLTLLADRSTDFGVVRLATSSHAPWTISPGPDSTISIGGHALPFGQLSAGFSYVDARGALSERGVRLDVVYELTASGLRATRHYLAVPGTPTFEVWTTLEPTSDRTPDVSNLNALTLTVPAGTIHSVRGLLGDSADLAENRAFTLQQTTLASGAHVRFGSDGRCSEETIPWFAVKGGSEELFATLLWSGPWSFRAERTGAALALTFGLNTMTTTIRGATDAPHVLIGVVRGGRAKASSALRSYVLDGLRSGRALTPLVTYNTWYARGVRVDEESVRGDMLRAAALGAELFVLDAGWYVGADGGGMFEFDTGLGTWQADPARFPNGLRPLRDYAHELGMAFGLWVEPERVNLDTVNRPGLADEAWLAKAGATYGSEKTALVCLGTAAARRWLLARLGAIIDDVQPDYLKWDNNFWVNCDRSGHDHGRADGSFAQVTGLYAILSALRERYPDMMIENVSGGGNRLDFGMLRYTDVAWMDDRTAPAVRVRHNLEGLSTVFPPAYLLSFVTDLPEEPLHESPDLPLYFRSRAAGVLGLSFRLSGLTDGDAGDIHAEVNLFKTTRAALATAASALLTAQAGTTGPAWDVLQETSSDQRQIVVWAFQADQGVARINVKPSGLRSRVTYEIRSAELGFLGVSTGADLAANGLDIVASPVTSAHRVVLTVQQ
jgi:alpha-galactosidase